MNRTIAKTLIEMARFYNHDADERTLEIYGEILSQFDQALVVKAAREYMRDIKNSRFPIPPHKIMAEYLPKKPQEKDLGIAQAMRIRSAIREYGFYRAEEAKAHLGQGAWAIVNGMGGWQNLCANLGASISESTFMAQVRDAADAMQRVSIESLDEKARLESQRSSELLPMGEVNVSKLMDRLEKINEEVSNEGREA